MFSLFFVGFKFIPSLFPSIQGTFHPTPSTSFSWISSELPSLFFTNLSHKLEENQFRCFSDCPVKVSPSFPLSSFQTFSLWLTSSLYSSSPPILLFLFIQCLFTSLQQKLKFYYEDSGNIKNSGAATTR